MDVRCDIGFDIVLCSICDGGDDEGSGSEVRRGDMERFSVVFVFTLHLFATISPSSFIDTIIWCYILFHHSPRLTLSFLGHNFVFFFVLTACRSIVYTFCWYNFLTLFFLSSCVGLASATFALFWMWVLQTPKWWFGVSFRLRLLYYFCRALPMPWQSSWANNTRFTFWITRHWSGCVHLCKS